MTSTRTLTAGSFWSFLAFGFIDNLKGPLLPEMIRTGTVNYAQAGLLALASYGGFVAATLTTGLIADRSDNRIVLWLAGLCIVLGGLGVASDSRFWWLMLVLAIVGYGLGAIELGANGMLIELHSDRIGRYLNLLSVFHGCGSLVVPLVAAELIALNWNWQTIYAVGCLWAVPLLLVFMPRSHRPTSPAAPQPTAARPASLIELDIPSPLWRRSLTPVMMGYYVLIAAYVATELSVGTWMMEYLQVNHRMSVEESSRYLSAFFLLLMFGRLCGATVIERFSYTWLVGLCLAMTGVCLAGALYGQQLAPQFPSELLLPVSGLCMSIVFPTVTASVSRLHPGKSGAVMGLLFACGGIGGAMGPWLVGQIGQRTELTTGLSMTLLLDGLALAALACIVCLQRSRHRAARSRT